MGTEEARGEEGEDVSINQEKGIDPNDRLYEALTKIEVRLAEIASALRSIAKQQTTESASQPQRPPKRG